MANRSGLHQDNIYIYLCWLSVALTVNPNIHYVRQLKHRCCRPPFLKFVYHEFRTLSCATKLD